MHGHGSFYESNRETHGWQLACWLEACLPPTSLASTGRFQSISYRQARVCLVPSAVSVTWPTRANRFLYAFVLSPLACGCSDASHDGTVLSGSALVFTSRQALPARMRAVVVISVDDTADDAGIALRNNLASAAHLQDAPVSTTDRYCPGTATDPMYSNPLDVRFAIIHPSANADERLITPSEMPALARLGEANDQVAYTEWTTSIQAAIGAMPTSRGSYELVGAVEETVALLTMQRGARTDKERLQLDSLALYHDGATFDSRARLIVNVATSHDDNGLLEISEYGDPSNWAFNEDTAVGVNLSAANAAGNPLYSMAEVAGTCPRVADWLRPVSIVPTGLDSLFEYRLWEKLKPTCLPAPPVTLRDGSVACRIHLWLTDGETCSAEKGQLDPLIDGVNRAPKTVSQEGHSFAVCELRQFDGLDLAACLNELAPSLPEPGWCFPDAPAYCSTSCPATQPIGQHFRFVRGINHPAAGGVLEFTCMLGSH